MITTFQTLGVPADFVAALDREGITSPFPVQALTIPDGLAGRDVCGKAKTGSGKTLAFGIPLVDRVPDAKAGRPTGLVLVPTRELAVQVHTALRTLADCRGRGVVAVYGGADLDRQVAALARGAEIVVATPGRLIDLLQRGDVHLTDVAVLVIDEADRMADMGFLPQVQWVMRHFGRAHQTMLFSATLDGEISSLVRELRDPVAHEGGSATVTVEDMVHRFLFVHEMDKVRVTATIAGSADRCLIFVRTKRGADRLTANLTREGVRVAAIHGDLRQAARERALNDFSAGKLPVLVATDVAARGIHVDDIDVVLHYDPPTDQKSYLHRSGRTARAGRAGVVATLVLWDQELEVRTLQKRLGLDVPLVEVFSNDPRLGDLAAWDGAPEAVA